ncbi:hypothetical protein [Saccharothrix sp. NRRL B-16348]|uniref:hypothetical protein n=1 Tax=Saccharothrix sp. NRRL B-16348 TaxID=1415542 RepID=UPI0012F7FD95|nr:hypothetical protein [Saccharothrix sp. NRRL B-16348]
MGGFAHMQVDGVEPALHRLTGTGENLAATWRDGQSGLVAGEAGIGADPLGQAFRAVYDADAAKVRQVADLVPELLLADGRTGHDAVVDYLAADVRSRGAFPGGG